MTDTVLNVIPAGDGEPDFRALFESAPVSYLVLDPDWVMVAVSDAYLRDTMTTREQLIGRVIFDMFPEDPDDPDASSGPTNLRASLERVRRDLVPDTMAVQKWDIRRPAAAGGEFEVRYWSVLNSPVLTPDGRLAYIINLVWDVTEYARLKERETGHREVTAELQRRTQRMEAEILARSRELGEANRALRAADDGQERVLVPGQS